MKPHVRVAAVGRLAVAWGRLSAPVRADETHERMRAQSIMAGGEKFRDGSTNPGTLTLDQARDVLRWARAPIM